LTIPPASSPPPGRPRAGSGRPGAARGQRGHHATPTRPV